MLTFSHGICTICKGLKRRGPHVLKPESVLKSQTWPQKYVLQTSDKDLRGRAAPRAVISDQPQARPYVSPRLAPTRHPLILTTPQTAARSAHPWPAPREKWAPASINILAGEVLKTQRGVKIKSRSEGETATRANSTGVRKWVSMHKGRLSYLRHPNVARKEKRTSG